EDGIRVELVTGVQTCALPISGSLRVIAERAKRVREAVRRHVRGGEVTVARIAARSHPLAGDVESSVDGREPFRLEADADAAAVRSEERRVGKERRGRGAPAHR